MGNPLSVQHIPALMDTSNSSATSNEKIKKQNLSDCRIEQLGLKDVELMSRNKVYIPAYNTIMLSSVPIIKVDNTTICFNRSDELKKEIFNHCSKWIYDADEYQILSNGSVLVYNDLMEPGTYAINDGNLVTCTISSDYYDYNSTAGDDILVHMKDKSPDIVLGKVGSSISIIALTGHLVTFCLVPTLRNLPGYNLASLCLAFLVGYSFVLIGQIQEVHGIFCIISGVLQQNFLLVAFFCMNVMAFDVFRTLKMATTKLATCSRNKKRNQFIMYSVYSWGVPLIITTISVVMDNAEGVPSWIKPDFGKRDTCWITNSTAKTIFFCAPAFTLFVANGVFFVMSAFIIKKNTMKNVSDHQNQTAKLNFILYVRLGLMMGVTWLIGIIATFSNIRTLWFIFDLLNSLQGLFIFLLFTCSRKVFKHFREKVSFNSPKTSNSDIKTVMSNSSKQLTKSTSVISA
ncbi:g-protein coupled receptor Mth2 [Nephila pilipes]|uniref:G-protein coupled receptor Mth2 n=1 Tax=Nephila pilipes TaxID=299642 RepID=A0A8X6N2N2_NEPPI|nr:g-protein coupled receptor Mth2 [Nephila pilipes]